ncbi:YicC/YloC family endoribonuclease [Jeotgalibacillus proteolyticus]|uniref:YicC family protein n=1 Tax=Jeotgalibacillus proteolyticus TaxID=2082395 RepID=A0A2S5GGL8_9BACL|nr:YicC/YloC family endoribonuclease [Jeotgalibacillus proteolyticus]PPA72108.1 YicC family protein [Jeotgalibacillus proteolyticus]
MIISMTGFGRGAAEKGDFRAAVEIKSVNHRFLECSIRIPRQHSHLEDKLKRLIGQYIKRGKADVFVSITGEGSTVRSLKVDWQLVDSYYDYAVGLKKRFNLNEEIKIEHFISNPDLSVIEEAPGSNEEEEALIFAALQQAAETLHSMRITEGKELEKDILFQLQSFKQCLTNAREISPTVTAKYHERLEKRIKEFADGQIDENRLLTEVAVFAEKTDVSEEFTRLDSHLAQFGLAMEKSEPVGRRLDFLTQEMNREVNTIGSKANDAKLVALVVDMKSILEKIREQIQNIE